MYTRDRQFYDLVSKGLASMGYVGRAALSNFINDNFAEKYNMEKTFAQIGFSVNPNLPINPTYEQIEATVRPYTMAGYVDIDSDGPTKSTDGMTLSMGGLPTFKHEIVLSRKILREKMMLADAIGGTNSEIDNVVVDLLFNAVDELLGGNYNTMAYQRHQIVSNKGKLVINAKNNPSGVPLEVDFKVNKKNIQKSDWYTKEPGTGKISQEAAVGKSINPLQLMKKVKREAELLDYAPAGHWEVSRTTWEDLLQMPYFRDLYMTVNRPDVTDATTKVVLGGLVTDETLKSFIEAQVGAPIKVIDAIASVESFDKATKAMKYTNMESFNEGILAYVPNDLGDVQFAKPIVMETPGARTALYDGDRTLLRQIFKDETMTQVIGSEVTGLVVPDKTRWMYYIEIKKG